MDHTTSPSPKFSYDLAFDRNLGWLTDWEQLALRAKRVAIAGLGGAGGAHLLTLARLGVGAFTIADFDRFDLPNFNRQAGATMATLGRPKSAVLEEMARDINPQLQIRRFDAGITIEQVDDFLAGVDLFADGLDFFEIPVRRQIFARCAERGIPAITAAPIGMGVGFLAFDPRGMSFESYFRFEGQSENEQFLRFLLGLAPAGLHRTYLVDATRVDLAAHKGPSTVAAIQLCAGVTAVAAIKLLLGRGGVKPAPWHHQYDPYRGRLAISRLRFGNSGPLQRLKLAIGRRQLLGRLAAAATEAPPPTPQPRSVIEEILNLGRWAPSGDNRQPWRFRVLDDQTVAIDLQPDPLPNLYDEYRAGEPTWLAAGMLIETLRIAASLWGREMAWEVSTGESLGSLLLRFPPAAALEADPLASFLTLRSVDRRNYRRRRLSTAEKNALEACFDGSLALDWHEGPPTLWRFGGLNAGATAIRLRAREAFPVHQRVLDWSHQHSRDRIPVGAIGLARPTLPLMRWGMQRWERMRLLNRLGGVAATAWQLDRLPALNSAAFFVVREGDISTDKVPRQHRLLQAGAHVQRFWLTAARLGLAVQPALAALIFADYGVSGERFTDAPELAAKAETHARRFRELTGRPPGEVLFVGRIGEPKPRLPAARSTRLRLDQLIEDEGSPAQPRPR